MKGKSYSLPRVVNLDTLFLTTENAITLNDMIVPMSSEDIVDILCDVSSADDNIEMIARCNCDKTRGNHHDGVVCKYCGTVCELSFGNIVKNDLWIVAPSAIKAVLNPQVYKIIRSWLGSCNRVPIIDILLDKSLPVPEQLTVIIPDQGFNAFYRNFDAIISYFAFVYPPTKVKENGAYIIEFLKRYREDIWCTHLPLVSKALQPITMMGNSNRYVDPAIKTMMKFMTNLKLSIVDDELSTKDIIRIEKNFFKVYSIFVDYTCLVVKEKLAAKKAILRKHCFGSRFHCTGRTVCVPITGEHYGDEIHLPWRIGVQVWSTQIQSLLVNRFHFSINKAYNKVHKALNEYSYQIDKCLQLLISESPYKGLPIILNRNPSLKLGAIQLTFVTKISPGLKSDPTVVITKDENGFDLPEPMRIVPDHVVQMVEDNTLKISPLIINSPNADAIVFLGAHALIVYSYVLPSSNAGIVAL